MFQLSINEGTLTRDWKDGNIAPIFKKGSRTYPANYRPISLTSVVCKHLMVHLSSYLLLSDHQYGFRKGRSCALQLIDVIDNWTKAIDEGDRIYVTYFDFAKAFDTVPTKGLLAKIQSYGIHGNILKWLTSFLTQRRQKVLVNGKSSGWCDVLSGVLQESVLGPILFIIFINDMPDKITSMVHLFADDTKISLRLTNQNQTNDLQNDIDRLDEWSDKWKLRFNIAKCKTMHIGYHNDKHIYQMGSGESRMYLNQVTSEKDLGITFQDDLQFTKHLADSMLGLIHCSFQHKDNEMLIHLYKALVRPHVEYASSMWSPFKLRDIKFIEGVQRRATRLSSDLRNEPYNIRLTTLGLATLQFRRERADMLQVFKILNGYEDIDSSRLFTLNSTGLHNHSLKLFKERSRLLLRKQTFTQRVVDSWNNLPENVVNAPSINAFKVRFNTHTRRAASKFCPTWYMPTIHIQRPQMRTRANYFNHIYRRVIICYKLSTDPRSR